MNKGLDLNIWPANKGSRPQVSLPDIRFLQQMGEEGLRKLISDQYELLSQSDVKHLFPPKGPALEEAKQRSSDFFVQICGGHPYYNENRGKPLLVKRHAPFKITNYGREVWLGCYQKLLPKLDIEAELIQDFWNYLNVFSIWMINSEED